jgi:hypothetical protein
VFSVYKSYLFASFVFYNKNPGRIDMWMLWSVNIWHDLYLQQERMKWFLYDCHHYYISRNDWVWFPTLTPNNYVIFNNITLWSWNFIMDKTKTKCKGDFNKSMWICMFPCIQIPHFVFLFLSQWILRLLMYFRYC